MDKKFLKCKCPVKGCKGQLLVTRSGSQLQERARISGHFVYFPGKCRVRLRKCFTCGKIQRTVEIPLDRYEKDLTLIRGLKVLLQSYVEGNSQHA